MLSEHRRNLPPAVDPAQRDRGRSLDHDFQGSQGTRSNRQVLQVGLQYSRGMAFSQLSADSTLGPQELNATRRAQLGPREEGRYSGHPDLPEK
jgi:hypothetical protein